MEIKTCTNTTPGPQDFTFENLIILNNYKLKVHTREWVIEKDINLNKIGKSVYLSIYLSIYLSTYLPIYLSNPPLSLQSKSQLPE